ncbi:MAG: efflux RND transporter permease subunit, partial [Gracilimonas sp.]
SGQYEYMERAKKRLQIVVPITLLIIFLLLYFNFKNLQESLIVLLTLPFSLVGSFWLLYLLDYNLSVAVGVGAIALAGVAAEIGVIMLTYLDNAYNDRKYHDRMNNLSDLKEAILEGSAQRIRPIFMTVCAITGGLLPIMWGMGTGATVMKRIAAPMVGGMISATALSLIVIPVIYYLWKSREVKQLEASKNQDQ